MNRKVFFDAIRLGPFAGGLSPSQVAGISSILDEWDRRAMSHWIAFDGAPDRRWLAYMLATVFHETAQTMQPISEYGGAHARYAPYYGRGLVQLTWKFNYVKAGKALGIDLVNHPEKALEWPVALVTLFDGMAQGWFTGMTLARYINLRGCDYVNARRIINLLDKANLIASYAHQFEAGLIAAKE